MEHYSADSYPAIAAEIEAAIADKLANEPLAELLVRHRAGCDTARDTLAHAHRWLLYAGRVDLAALSTRYAALADAINRLRADPTRPRSKGPRLAADEVENFLAAEIRRSHFDYRRAESTNIHPPASTASDRTKRGKDSGSLKRQGLPPEVPKGRQIMPVDVAEANELFEHCARDAFEREVLAMLSDGYAIRAIAVTLGATKYRVETAVALFRERANELAE